MSDKIMHGLSSNSAYNCWKKMRSRCRNPKDSHYKYYGAKGIAVCERWDDFAAFLEDIGRRPSPGHTIERIDNGRGYEPGNCRWATQAEQNKNRDFVARLHVGNATLFTADVAKIVGRTRQYITRLVARGLTLEQVLEKFGFEAVPVSALRP